MILRLMIFIVKANMHAHGDMTYIYIYFGLLIQIFSVAIETISGDDVKAQVYMNMSSIDVFYRFPHVYLSLCMLYKRGFSNIGV